MAPVYVGHRLVERRYIGALEVTGVYLGVRELFNSAIAVLRKFGADAHVYLPGGNVMTYGPELVTGWSDSGDANLTATGNTVTSVAGVATNALITGGTTSNLTLGKTVKVSYTISGLTNGSMRLLVYGNVNGVLALGSTRSANGAYEDYLVMTAAGSDSNKIKLQVTAANTALTCSNISVKEVLANTSVVLNGLQAANYLDNVSASTQAVDQPVGLVLDAAGSVGPELVVNGDFSSGATGWTSSGTVSFPAGGCTIVSDGGYVAITKAISASVVGRVYRYSIRVLSTGGGMGVSIAFAGTQMQNGTPTVGVYSGYLTAASVTSTFEVKRLSGVTNVTFTDISFKEVTGIHASQITTENKPRLRRGAVNLLTESENLASTNWYVNGTASKSGSSVLTPANHDACFHGGAAAIGTYTSTFCLSGSGTCSLFAYNATDGIIGRRSITLTATPTEYSTTFTTTAVNTSVQFGRWDGDTATAISFTHAQLQVGSTATPYIPTTTAPASAPTGPYHWDFDGNTDALSLGAPLFQMADDHCVIAGIYSNAGASEWSTIYGQTGAGNTPRIQLYIDGPTGKLSLYSRDDSAVAIPMVGTSDRRNVMSVVTYHKAIGSRKLRVNGTQEGGTASGLLGAATFTAAAIGSNVTDFVRGAIYPVIAIKGTVSDAELLILEKLVANLSGVTL